MAHFAKLDSNNIVEEVIVIANGVIYDLPFPESEPYGVDFCKELYGKYTNWKQTSYNGSFRNVYAGIGFTYDPVNDVFIEPQPYLSWTLNQTTFKWEAPIPYPTDGKDYYWDEETTSWVEVSNAT